ncbi:MAG: hypothetical protein GF393_10410, partial [Armatimonadia bacterium]|nr:hypothetical protein [Armatimonadia bacterium]
MARTLSTLVALILALPATAQYPLVENERTDWVLYHAGDAPGSVEVAAQELQRVVRASTGVEIPIVDQPAAPMICLGDNAASRAAGLSAEDLPRDGYRIRTVNGSLYICGREFPDDRPEWIGWTSRGTLYGVYDVLERLVGVRWLMPGEVGEDIPRNERIGAPVLDIEATPDFEIRNLMAIRQELPEWFEDRELVRKWMHT